MKTGIRVLSVGTGPSKVGKTLLAGIVSRDGMVEGIVSTKVTVDGEDATQRIITLFKSTRFSDQIKLIAMNGIGVAGLNIVDINLLNEKTGCEVLSVTRNKPHPGQLIKALHAFSRDTGAKISSRIELVKKIKKMNMFKVKEFYIQTTMQKLDAVKFFDQAKEQLRLVHLIASGVSTGESRGRM